MRITENYARVFRGRENIHLVMLSRDCHENFTVSSSGITFQTFFLKRRILISLLFCKHILRKEGISDKANNHLLSCFCHPSRQENDLYIFCTEFMSFLFFETWRKIRTTSRISKVTIQKKMGFVLIYCCWKISYL